MSPKKTTRPVDPKPLYAAVGALDLAIAELRTAADDATGKARKQVDEALATATALRKDVARRARRAGGAAEGGAEHALNTGLTVASDANQRYEALADRGTKVVGGLLDAPVVRGVAGQVDDAARLVESVRSAADKAVESLLSLTGIASRAGAERDAERLPLADEPAPVADEDAPAPIKPKRPSRSAVKAAAVAAEEAIPVKPKRPSRSSVKAAAQTLATDAGEPGGAEPVAPAPKVTTTKATTSTAAARKTAAKKAAKKATATPATRKPAKKTTGRAAGTKVTTKNVTAAVEESSPTTPASPAAPASPVTPAASVTPAGQAEPATKAPIVPTDLTGPTA